jgi:hypothetical protein
MISYSVVRGAVLATEVPGGKSVTARPGGRDVISLEAVEGTDDCIVLGDYRGHYNGPLRNLHRLRPDGSIVWTAEFPARGLDFFTQFRITRSGIRGFASSGYSVLINIETGRTISATFVK